MKFFIPILLFFITFSNAAIDEKKELDKVSLQLHWKYQFEFAGFIAAKEKGFYKDAGLDVELKEYEFGMDIEADVLSGKSEFGIYNSLSLLEYLRGKPLVLISSYFKRAALVLVTAPDIKSPKDLIGKKIMASTKEDFILNYQPYFESYGVDVEDVELVPHSYGIEEFANGEVSAMTAFVSNELHKLDERGIKYNILDPSDENLYVLQLELITSQYEAEYNPERVEAFKEASLKGWEYALSHKKELTDIIYEKYSDKFSKKDIMDEGKGVEKLILPYTYNIGSIDKNFLNKQIKLFKEYYKVGYNKNLNDYLFKGNDDDSILLSESEKLYIKNNQIIPLCIQFDHFPIDGYINGKFVGIMSDVYAIISKKTSLKFKIIQSNSPDALKQNIESKKCQLLSAFGTENTIYKGLRASSPFITTYFTLISKLDKSFVNHPNMIEDKLLLTQFDAHKKYLKNLYPFLNIKVVEDRNKMIDMLLDGQAYAIIAIDEQSDYLIDKYGYGKLKINGFLAKDMPVDVSIGVQEENSTLYSIIEKVLSSISYAEMHEIIHSWRITRYQSVVDYSLTIKILVIMFLIFLIMAYYHKKLKNFNVELEYIVNEKTKELRKINESLEEKVAQKVDELLEKDEILTRQSKQAVMGEMISMIAHQWRQPLNTITLNISNLQIKQMMGQRIEDEFLTHTLDEISETIVYLSETVDDFKTYFHPDKEKNSVEVDDVINKAINFVSSRAKVANVEILFIEKSFCKMEVYQNELIQVLLNILNNAIDAYILIEKEEKTIEVYAKKEDDTLVICIKDEAGGIKAENIHKLFEPYFSTKGKNGTGLGLYMSQMIIEKQFNGKIEVDSFESTSKFTIKIPIIESVSP